MNLDKLLSRFLDRIMVFFRRDGVAVTVRSIVFGYAHHLASLYINRASLLDIVLFALS